MDFLREVGVLKHLEDVFGYFIKFVINRVTLFRRNLRARNKVSPTSKVRNQAILKAACKLLDTDDRSFVKDFSSRR